MVAADLGHDNFVRCSRSARKRLTDKVERFRGGLVFKAHRLFYHSTLGSSRIKKKKKKKMVD